jgi:hypothetical protein
MAWKCQIWHGNVDRWHGNVKSGMEMSIDGMEMSNLAWIDKIVEFYKIVKKCLFDGKPNIV